MCVYCVNIGLFLIKIGLVMLNIDSESLSIISKTADDLGNYTLVAATIIGLISVDLVVLSAIISKARESKEHDRRRPGNSDWELFRLTQTYYHSFNHHCCYGYHHRRRTPIDDGLFSNELFIAVTMGVSLITTAVAFALAIHFHLTAMAMFLSGIWLTGFALKTLAYALKPNITPTAPPLTENQSTTIPTAIPVSSDNYSMFGSMPQANAFIIENFDPFQNASAPPLSIQDAYTLNS